MTLASFAQRTLSRLRGRTAINLVGESRPGGYLFLKSPELPGFSLMLAPGQHEELDAFMQSVSGPLKAFVAAEMKANHRNKLAITGASKTNSTTYLAELCAA